MTDPNPPHPGGKMLWTRSKLNELQKLRDEAVANNQDHFLFTTELLGPEGMQTVTGVVTVKQADISISHYDRVLRNR